jgi:hypothetical protein
MSQPDPKIELHEAVDDFVKKYSEVLVRTELNFAIDHPNYQNSWIWEKFREYIEE